MFSMCLFNCTRDASPVRWPRRRSSSSDKSERHCYNVQTSSVTTERVASSSPGKRDKKKRRKQFKKYTEQEERRDGGTKRTPLLERVCRLGPRDNQSELCINDQDDQEDEEERATAAQQFRSMCELRVGGVPGLARSELRRSICETDLERRAGEEEEGPKLRSKSQSRVPFAGGDNRSEDKFVLFGFKQNESPKPSRRRRWRKSRDALWQGGAEGVIEKGGKERCDSLTPSSCLAAKFRAMQNRYLKSSTSRLIGKLYKKESATCSSNNSLSKDQKRLRSFSYGALPGLDELRTNPLFDEHEQHQDRDEDNDSGILDNDSATSSLLDDRCSSVASETPMVTSHDTATLAPPRIPPRRPSGPSALYKRGLRLFQSTSLLDAPEVAHATPIPTQPPLVTCDEPQQPKEPQGDKGEGHLESGGALSVIRSSASVKKTLIVKLQRETSEQSLGIFIAKTPDSAGYLVAHVVPGGLADREDSLRIGDEILIVNGKRLRGLTMPEARKILSSGASGEIDIVVTRMTPPGGNSLARKRLLESSVDYENVSIENGHGVIVTPEPPAHGSYFRKHQSKRSAWAKRSEEEGGGRQSDKSMENLPNFCTLPRRPRHAVSTFLTVVFEKGPGKKSLGFTIVGGRDSPKGSIGIFVKSVLLGQAAEDGRLRAGDEIVAVNGQICHDLTHREAVQLFRNIKNGPIALHLCRRMRSCETQAIKAKSCADLLMADT
ncbi:partitioning defective 3 homolog B [Copidosoma floridanum]|uniref:partitioning defective 3 homolog B n=1 Tax=Copidosoma floridanum TaxID=29053 RepID=UPI0006C93BCE|nr:partitioning defective 3 homolog B [Copidosoma floridanum]